MSVLAEAIGTAADALLCKKGKTQASTQKRVGLPVHCWNRKRDELVLLLVTQGFWESRYAKFVHNGTCNRAGAKHCDSGRAATVWQIQATRQVTKRTWNRMIGTGSEPTRLAAFTAARLLSNANRTCGSVEGAIALYGTGKGCRWSGARRRLQFWWRLRQKHLKQHSK